MEFTIELMAVTADCWGRSQRWSLHLVFMYAQVSTIMHKIIYDMREIIIPGLYTHSTSDTTIFPWQIEINVQQMGKNQVVFEGWQSCRGRIPPGLYAGRCN